MHLDQLDALARHPQIPPDERLDVNAEIWQTFGKDIHHHPSFPDLDELREWIPGLSEYAKAASPLTTWWRSEKVRRGEHVSILQVNEYGSIDLKNSRWREKPGNGFAFLKDVRNSVDLISAVILTRKRQITPFLRPERAQGPLGFHFIRADGGDITDRDRPAIRRLEEALESCGDEPNYFRRQRLQRDKLVNFVSKIVMDTLAADACPIELIRTNGGKLSGWHSVAFDTVRLTVESGYQGDDQIRAVQVIDDTPHVTYGYEDLIYEVRNPRTDLTIGGYGMSEAEQVIRAMTGYINAVTFNMAGIDRNSMPRGFVTLIGKYDTKGLGAFSRQMIAQFRGASQRHGVTILASEDKTAGALWTPIDQFDEMYFARWMVFLVSIVCAVYGIDPNEIHFDSFNIRSSSLSGSDTSEKLALSRDKGLIPLLMFIEDLINILVAELNPRYRFEFVGIHQEDEARKHERVKLGATFAELRALDGGEPTGDKLLDDCPVNQTMVPVYLQSRRAENPESNIGDTGDQEDPGGEDGPAGADFRKAALSQGHRNGFVVTIEPDGAATW